MILVLVVLGRYRYVDAAMPAASSCSLAISAAAHPAASEPDDVSTLPLQYGVVPGTEVPDVQYTRWHDNAMAPVLNPRRGFRKHVGFSSVEVDALQSGTVYW